MILNAPTTKTSVEIRRTGMGTENSAGLTTMMRTTIIVHANQISRLVVIVVGASV